MTTRSFLIKHKVWVALIVVSLISWWASGLEDDPQQAEPGKGKAPLASAARKPSSAKAGAQQRDPTEALALIATGFQPRKTVDKLSEDPFGVVSYEPPPPPPPPPPKPSAPPLNFKYLGALRDGDGDDSADSSSGAAAIKERAVFLDSGGQLLIAHKGDTLAGQYRVLEINDTNMQFEYLPLAERQTLNFGR